jgi:SPOR domain
MNWRRDIAPAIAAITSLMAATSAFAQVGRLMDASAVTERDDHLDLSIDFNCSLRYQTHSPANEGASVRITLQFGPDCGMISTAQFSIERMLPADTTGLVRSLELQPGLAGGAELTVSWNRIEKYVIAPAAGMRGLRLRVNRPKASTIIVNESAAAIGSYAVNILSSQSEIPAATVAEATQLLKTPVYVSDVLLSDGLWHRLRAGPFNSRREAEGVLREAQNRYASAWLGIDDETTETKPEDGELVSLPNTPAVARAPEQREDAALDKALTEAKTAMSRRRFDDAIAQLNNILTKSDYVHRVDAQEMLGLARERKGQLAHAKAEYEEFLRRYAAAPAAGRVRQRLQALRTASLAGRSGTGGGAASNKAWSGYGSASQVYRRDNSQLRSVSVSRDLVTQNALISDVDWVLRHRGDRTDFTARTSFGYLKDLLSTGPGDQARVSSAYVEMNDRELGLGAKLGRQSRGMAGVFGSFDGLLGTWQWKPRFGFNLAMGSPVDSTRSGFDSGRQFLGVAADFATADRKWDTSVYALAQQYKGSADRRSLGIETRYLRPGRTMVAMVDYDVNFSTLNNVTLLGTLVLDSHWTFSADVSRQSSPLLSLRNALIGQPTASFDDLSQVFTQSQIEQLALDRSSELTQISVSASHPLGDRAQWSLNAISTDFTGTPASGGVEAVPALGREDAITSELMVNSLFKAGDMQSVAFRFQRGGSGNLLSLGVGSRLPIGSALRLTSRLRVDRRSQLIDGSSQWLYLPSMQMNYQKGRGSAELELGAELGRRNGTLSNEQTTRFFFSLGYRLSLDLGGR